MVSWFELNLTMASGLSTEAAWELQRHAQPHLAHIAAENPMPSRRGVCWPDAAAVRALQRRIQAAGLSLAWRGGVEYPLKLTRRMDKAAPAWVWLAGSRRRLIGRACGMVGSRHHTPPAYLRAARTLAEALAAEGVAIVSGMAAGADASAHAGALLGAAGTVGIPARGLLHARCGAPSPPGLTLLGLDTPDAPFRADIAIRRNALIPALSEALILIASDLKGGSAHAVNWARRRGMPLFTLSARRDTPAGNLSLVRSGLATALDLNAGPAAWLEVLMPAIHASTDRLDCEASHPRAFQPTLFGEDR